MSFLYIVIINCLCLEMCCNFNICVDHIQNYFRYLSVTIFEVGHKFAQFYFLLMDFWRCMFWDVVVRLFMLLMTFSCVCVLSPAEFFVFWSGIVKLGDKWTLNNEPNVKKRRRINAPAIEHTNKLRTDRDETVPNHSSEPVRECVNMWLYVAVLMCIKTIWRDMYCR